MRPANATHTRIYYLVIVALLIILERVFLSPSGLDENYTYSDPVDPMVFVENHTSQVVDLPQGKIPDYSVDQFNYVSVQNGKPLWKILAEKAYMFNPERVVHAIEVHAFLFDTEGTYTKVTGKEAKYQMNERNLEIFGEVVTQFPDGFELLSDYLQYFPETRRILIPTQYRVEGKEKNQGSQQIRFVSQGLDYQMADNLVFLPNSVEMTLIQNTPQGSDETLIESDFCTIYRNSNLAEFRMDPSRKTETQFVHISQKEMFTRARRADLKYGSQKTQESSQFHELIANEDVLIKEIEKDGSLRYATAGRAEFDNKNALIYLHQYPQVYQDGDTVVGDVIIMHRDTNIVEVAHSNAFSAGTQETPKSSDKSSPPPTQKENDFEEIPDSREGDPQT